MSRKQFPLALVVASALAMGALGTARPAHAQAPAPDVAPGVAPDAVAVATPSRGMTMAQVAQRFGAPAERYAPVGDPPITRWVYADKVVYFEHDHVVHAVVVKR